MLTPRDVMLKSIKAVKDFKDVVIDAQSFIDSFVESQKITDEGDAEFIASVFLGCIKHQPMLKIVVDGYYASDGVNCPRVDRTLYTTLCYLSFVAIGDIGVEGLDVMLMALPRTQMTKAAKFLAFAWDSSSVMSWIKDAWCLVYDRVYVDTELLDPIIDASDSVLAVIGAMNDEIETRGTKTPTPQLVTQPKPFNLTQPRPKIIRVPKAVEPMAKHIPPPKTTYQSPIQLEARERKRHLAAERTLRARQLGAHKREMVDIVAKQTSSARIQEELNKYSVKVTPTELPSTTHKPTAQVKLNAGAILREEQLFRQRADKEMKRLKDVEVGAFDIESFLEWEQEQRATEEQEQLDLIEVRRLEGLISREDALLARQSLLDQNQKAVLEQKKKTETLMARYIAEKVEQGEINRRLVKDTALLYARVKKAQEKAALARAEIKKKVESESKALLVEAAAREAAELEKRDELIRQIRAFEMNPIDRTKFIDLTETAGFGLLTEMSFIELRERLSMLKVEAEQEETERRDKILKTKKEAEESLAQKVESIAFARAQRQKVLANNRQKSAALKTAPRKTDARVEELRAKLAAKKNGANAVRATRKSLMKT
eukprot:m.108922 g.108922  ORF g.108922 m.108922 type:complete len:601 (+) comp27916_c0_seq1:231-2033(+)